MCPQESNLEIHKQGAIENRKLLTNDVGSPETKLRVLNLSSNKLHYSYIGCINAINPLFKVSLKIYEQIINQIILLIIFAQFSSIYLVFNVLLLFFLMSLIVIVTKSHVKPELDEISSSSLFLLSPINLSFKCNALESSRQKTHHYDSHLSSLHFSFLLFY